NSCLDKRYAAVGRSAHRWPGLATMRAPLSRRDLPGGIAPGCSPAVALDSLQRLPNRCSLHDVREEIPATLPGTDDEFRDGALRIDVSLVAGLTVNIGPSIHRIAEHAIDGGVTRHDPLELMTISQARHDTARVHGEGQILRAEPHPDLACRAQLREFGKDGTDDTGDGFIGMETNLTLLFAPHQPHGQGTT